MRIKWTIFGVSVFWFAIVGLLQSCAGIIPPNGGPKDSLPPRLIMALPKDSALDVKTQKIILTFDEFVEIKDIAQNVLVSPNPSKSPLIDYKLRTITVKLRDSLEKNTTYSINFGNSIRDINEGNVFSAFTYTFSTGNQLADGSFSGKVILAETGKVDSTLIVVLHRNLHDSAIYKSAPRYITRLDGKGRFSFKHLAIGEYKAFVLPNDYSKKYDDSTKFFGFLDTSIIVSNSTEPALFYAYQQDKPKEKAAPKTDGQENTKANKEDKRLKYMSSIENNSQDLLGNIQLVFNRKLTQFDSSQLVLCDTFYNPMAANVTLDTGRTTVTLRYPWKEASAFKLLVQKEIGKDSNGIGLNKTDTLPFNTKNESDYGSIKLRFFRLKQQLHPVLQLVVADKIEFSEPLNGTVFSKKLFKPGDYIIRILYDDNQNGHWDPGNYKKRQQPEKVVDNNWKLNIKANWDNESDITLADE